MRISTQQIFNSGVSNMQKGQVALAKTQAQIATGKNLNSPSDDPVAAAQILKYRNEIAASGAYEKNIEVSQRRLELEELTLQQVNDAADRLNELAIQANNSTINNENRAGIAEEVIQVQQFMLGLMNTQDSQGEYLFSGARGGTEPFDKHDFSYKGDSEVRFIQTGPSAMIQSTDSGRSVFQVVPGDVKVEPLNSTKTTNAGVESPFEVKVKIVDAEPEFKRQPDLSLTVTAAVAKVDAVAAVAAADAIGVVGSPGYLPAVEAVEAVEAAAAKYTLTSADKVYSADIIPGTSVVEISPPGLSFDLGADVALLADGDVISTTIRTEQPRHSILTTAQKLIDALQTPITDQKSRDESAAMLATVITEIGTAQEGLLQIQAQIGGRLGALENQDAVNQDFDLFTQAALSSLEDLDYASAISKFKFQEVALQAAQQTFSRVNQLSLFNYL